MIEWHSDNAASRDCYSIVTSCAFVWISYGKPRSNYMHVRESCAWKWIYGVASHLFRVPYLFFAPPPLPSLWCRMSAYHCWAPYVVSDCHIYYLFVRPKNVERKNNDILDCSLQCCQQWFVCFWTSLTMYKHKHIII